MGEVFNEVKRLLEAKPIQMDAFDSSYLSDFHHIMRENFGIESLDHPELATLVELTGVEGTVKDLRDLLVEVLNEEDFRPKVTTPAMKQKFKYTNVDDWENLTNVRREEDVEAVKQFLAKYSIQSGGNKNLSDSAFAINWGRTPQTQAEVERIIREYISSHEDVSMLTIGPRWAAEVSFLRNKFGIHVLGLDLFTQDESMVVVGDMHDMEFDDNTFDIVYEKNTYNKSYDIRKALDESVRVLKPGGLLIYDECMDYTCGVNENARTNIKTHDWTVTYLGDKIDEVLMSTEISSNQRDKWYLNKVGVFVARVK